MVLEANRDHESIEAVDQKLSERLFSYEGLCEMVDEKVPLTFENLRDRQELWSKIAMQAVAFGRDDVLDSLIVKAQELPEDMMDEDDRTDYREFSLAQFYLGIIDSDPLNHELYSAHFNNLKGRSDLYAELSIKALDFFNSRHDINSAAFYAREALVAISGVDQNCFDQLYPELFGALAQSRNYKYLLELSYMNLERSTDEFATFFELLDSWTDTGASLGGEDEFENLLKRMSEITRLARVDYDEDMLNRVDMAFRHYLEPLISHEEGLHVGEKLWQAYSDSYLPDSARESSFWSFVNMNETYGHVPFLNDFLFDNREFLNPNSISKAIVGVISGASSDSDPEQIHWMIYGYLEIAHNEDYVNRLNIHTDPRFERAIERYAHYLGTEEANRMAFIFRRNGCMKAAEVAEEKIKNLKSRAALTSEDDQIFEIDDEDMIEDGEHYIFYACSINEFLLSFTEMDEAQRRENWERIKLYFDQLLQDGFYPEVEDEREVINLFNAEFEILMQFPSAYVDGFLTILAERFQESREMLELIMSLALRIGNVELVDNFYEIYKAAPEFEGDAGADRFWKSIFENSVAGWPRRPDFAVFREQWEKALF